MASEVSNIALAADRLQVILEINNSIASNLDLYDLLRSISASVRKALRCDAASVSIPEGDYLRVYTRFSGRRRRGARRTVDSRQWLDARGSFH